MLHQLPAVCLSTFLSVPKKAVPSKKENKLVDQPVNSVKYNAGNSFETGDKPGQEPSSATPGLRVVAVSLTNNTDQSITVKNSLIITEGEFSKHPVDFTPPYVDKKQAKSVYFLYKLLSQRLALSLKKETASSSEHKPEMPAPGKATGIFTNVDNQNFAAELKEANLFYKFLAPGQTVTGLLLFYSSSAAPILFYLK